MSQPTAITTLHRRRRTAPLLARACALLLSVICASCSGAGQQRNAADATGWVGTWATAQQLTEPANMPPPPGLAGNTLRQIVQVSIGGARLRLRLSNEFGNAPLTVNAVHVARAADAAAIDPATGVALTFAGQPAITIPLRATTVSDAFDFVLPALSRVAITIQFGAVPDSLTGHPGSRTTSYLQPGGAAGAPDLTAATRTTHWYVITGIDVVAGPGSRAVVAMGNSITDGRGSTTDAQNRWPDVLARRLHEHEATRSVAVLNHGIGGNCVLRACLGPSALARFERDVLQPAGVRWLIVLEGVNDIGQATDATAMTVADNLIAAYGAMIERAHARGIRVYGATIMPFGGSFYDRPAREAARQRVNDWIRTSGRFDAVIDSDAAVRDPSQPSRLLPTADTGDHLHPNELGHRLIAQAVDLALFQR